MDAVFSGVVTIGLIALFLGGGVWIFSGLLLVAVCVLSLVMGYPIDRIGFIVKGIMWRAASSWEVAAIPIFILMGELIYRTDLSDRIFRGLTPLVDWLPGRLLHTNITGCTLFAAVSGSSAATTVTIGKITLNALVDRGYDRNLAVGSLAGAGSLGLLIPPSIVMIIYGILAEVSIARLFAAGILPGLLVAGLYSGYIMTVSGAGIVTMPPAERRYTWRDRVRGLVDLIPIIVLIAMVLGSIYTGFATPSEAAAIGFAGTVVVTLALRRLTFRIFVDSLMNTVTVSAMVCSILVSAAVLSTAMGYAHVPQDIARAIAVLDLSPYALIAILSLFYILLGLFLDGISITVMSLPITLPVVLAAGWDPIWFGVYLVVMVELAQITPPVGFNLFVIQGLTGWSINRIAKAALPFFLLLCCAVFLLVIFPGIALWLPARIWQ